MSSLVGNEYSFNQDFLDKVIEVTGKIATISGTQKSAAIGILGNTRKSKDDLTFRDTVSCTISNSNALFQVRKVKVGDSVTVRGTYKKGFMGQIDLTNCRIM